MITKHSTVEEIEQAASAVAEFIKLKDETIKVLKEKCAIAEKFIASQEGLLKVKQEQIEELTKQLESTFTLAKRATDLASRSSVLPTVESYTNSLKKLSEQAEERKLIKEILSDPRNADGFSDDAHRLPKYQYQGYTYILNDRLTEIVGVEVPTTIVDRWHLEQSLKER